MREERGVAIVAYKQGVDTPRFLVLKRVKNWEGWELPKGHLEEDMEETVYQEIGEEAGIPERSVLSVEEMEYDLTWEYEDDGETVKRKYRGFIVEVEENATVDVSGNPHEEHSKGHFFRKRDAESLLTYPNQKNLLEKGYKRIVHNKSS